MLNEDYREMLQCLQNEGCDFVIVGAYALAVHGLPRSTGDIDIFIHPEPANAQAVFAALAAFGAPVGQISPADLSTPGNVLQIGVAPCRIDILTAIDGVTFAEVAATAHRLLVDGLDLPFISKAALIKNKRSTGRPRDIEDAAWLEHSL
jgi:predicted nucleotidyltransferase